LALATLFAVPHASAMEPLVFGDAAETGGMLAFDEIFLRNRGGQDLDFYISRDGDPWERYRIPEGKAANIDAEGAKLAIATAPIGVEDDVIAAPALTPDQVTTPKVGDRGLYYYALFKGSERIDLCWSSSADRWIAQRPRDGNCD